MTYRDQTAGLGAISDADRGNFYRVLAREGCSPAFATAMSTAPCLNVDAMDVISLCIKGQKAGDITDGEFGRACAALMSCGGVMDKPGCPELRALLPAVPACASPDLLPSQEYCRTYGWAGPDPALNAQCWAVARFPDWYGALLALPPCGASPPAPPLVEDSTPDAVPPARGESSRAGMLALYGVLGLAALGGGYLLFGRKH